MGNIKSVRIEGAAPYDICDDDPCAAWLGFFHGPLSKLKFTWNVEDQRNWFSTNLFRFTIVGETSMLFSHLHEFVDEWTKSGKVEFASISVFDIEDGHDHWLWERDIEGTNNE